MKQFFAKQVVKITYLAVFIFIVVYVVIIQIQSWFKLSASWQPVAVAFAALFAAPLIFALLWERITSIKAFDIEIGLSEVQIPTSDTSLDKSKGKIPSPNVIQELSTDITNTIWLANETKLVKVNLATGRAWRIAYLYLLAAFLEDESEAQQIVFVDNYNGQTESFIGLATPEAIRRTIGYKFPMLEELYRASYVDFMRQDTQNSRENSFEYLERKVRIVLQFFWSLLSDRQGSREQAGIFEGWVTKGLLSTWLKLDTNSVRFTQDQVKELQKDQKFTPSLLSIIIGQANGNIDTFRLDSSTRFLVIIQGEQLLYVVDLLQLAVRVAADAKTKK